MAFIDDEGVKIYDGKVDNQPELDFETKVQKTSNKNIIEGREKLFNLIIENGGVEGNDGEIKDLEYIRKIIEAYASNIPEAYEYIPKQIRDKVVELWPGHGFDKKKPVIPVISESQEITQSDNIVQFPENNSDESKV